MSAPTRRSISRDEDGATATEYAVMLALILMAVIAAIGAVGDSSLVIWGNNVERITGAIR